MRPTRKGPTASARQAVFGIMATILLLSTALPLATQPAAASIARTDSQPEAASGGDMDPAMVADPARYVGNAPSASGSAPAAAESGTPSATAPPPSDEPEPDWSRPSIPPSPEPRVIVSSASPNVDTDILSPSKQMRLHIPSGAVDRAVEFEIAEQGPWRPRDGGMLNIFELKSYVEANGDQPRREISQFPKALTLTIRHEPHELRGLDLSTLALYRLDETTRKWQPVPTSRFDPETLTLTASINHFSFYGERAEPNIAGPGRVMAFESDLYSGAAVFSYPIEVPPGRAGFQPSLTLTYNSASADEMKNKRDVGSWVGTGWSLGLGSVTYDDQADRYYLNMGGASYLLDIDWYGAYHTVPESFYKITRTGQHWDVYDRQGNHYRYGGTADSQQYYDSSTYYRWDLSYCEDTNGNAITVTYVQDTWNDGSKTHVRAAYPSHVRYNDDHVDVQFNSSLNRPDMPQDPAPKVSETRRLDSIEVKVDGSLVRKYDFTYQTTSYYRSTDYGGIDYAGKHKLMSLQETGSDGTSTLPAMNFTYADLQTYLYDTNQTDYDGNPGNPASFNWPHLTTVTNGYGATITQSYTQIPSSSATDIWTREAVTGKEINPGTGPVQTYQYEYTGNPRYFEGDDDRHEVDDAFRGFAGVKVTDAEGHYTRHYFHTTGSMEEERLTGREYKTEWYDAAGGLLERKEYDWDYLLYGNYKDGLVSCWYFNHNSGNMATDATGQHDGTVNGATWVADGSGFGGYSLEFHPDDTVSVGTSPDFAFGGDFTVEAWIKMEPSESGGAIIHRLEDPLSNRDNGYFLGYSDEFQDRMVMVYADDEGITTNIYWTQGNLRDGAWHHVALVFRDHRAVDLYVDGAEASPTNYYNPGMRPGTVPFNIGGPEAWFYYYPASVTVDYFDGKIDNVAAYDRALATLEIAEHHASGMPILGGPFVYLNQVTHTTDPNGPARRTTRTTYDYDSYGNVTDVHREGDIADPNETVEKAC